LKSVEDLKKELEKGSERLSKFGLALADNGDVLTTDPTVLIRFQRSKYALEGVAGKYSDLADQMKGQEQDDMKATSLYERDHIPGLEPLERLKSLSEELNKGAGGAPTPVRSGPAAKAKQGKSVAALPPLGAFHTRSSKKPGATFKAIVVDKKFNVRGADAQDHKAFDAAVGKPTLEERKVAAEAALSAHVEERANQIAAEYGKVEEKETRDRVAKGLTDIRQSAKMDFGLGAELEAQQREIEPPKPGEARSSSIPFEDPANPKERNFAEGEGRSGNYKTTTNSYPNQFLVFDHVLDSSFVEAVKDWKANTLWAPVLPRIDAAAAKSDDAKARREELSETKIFGGPALSSYSHNTSLAVGIFVRVNDRVATEAGTYKKPKAHERILNEIKSASLEPMVDYVKDGTGSPGSALQNIKIDATTSLDSRFKQHRAVIENSYQTEQKEVAAANAEPPARKAAADAQMNIILARMKLSLQSMNSEKEALFK
jgi:hypothetical protein